MMDPAENTSEDPVEPDPQPEESVEGGTNPITVATQPETNAPTPAATPPTSTDQPTESTADTGDTTTTSSVDPEADTISGSQQSDTIDAGAGDDVVDGRFGDDTIQGGTGADSVSGSEGNDVLYGGGIDGVDDGSADTLSGGEGDDQIHMGESDVATGDAGADTFIRQSSLTTRALVTDFDIAEDVIVVQHQSDTPPTVDAQRVASDGVILELSDGSQIELAGLTQAIDSSLISFVDTRVP